MRACFPECKSTFAYIRKICEIHSNLTDFMVEVTGFEPATFWSRNPNKCSFLSSPDRKRRAFPSLFCLRRTKGDRFGCRIVAYCLGDATRRYAKTGSGKCIGISVCNGLLKFFVCSRSSPLSNQWHSLLARSIHASSYFQAVISSIMHVPGKVSVSTLVYMIPLPTPRKLHSAPVHSSRRHSAFQS